MCSVDADDAGAPVWAAPLLGLPDALAAQGAALAAQGAALAALAAQVAAQGAALGDRIDRESARNWNGSAHHPASTLRPVSNGGGVLPAMWFPGTLGNLLHNGGALGFTDARANALIDFYGLPPIGGGGANAIQQKKDAIAGHIGVRF